MYFSCFIILSWSLIWIHPCLICIQHPLMMMMMTMVIKTIIIIVIMIILLVIQLLLSLLLLLFLLLSLLSTSSSFFCVSECFLTGVWLFDIHFVSLGKQFIRSRSSNRPAVLLLLFIYFVNFRSVLYLFFYSFSFTFSCRASGEK